MSLAATVAATGAKPGLYFSFLDGDAVRVTSESDGEARDLSRYVRLPAPILVALGPILGFLFVMFLPLLTILMVAAWPVRTAVKAVSRRIAVPARVEPQLARDNGTSERIAFPE